MRFQADILPVKLQRPANAETTAAGAGYLVGLSTGFWDGMGGIRSKRIIGDPSMPRMEASDREKLLRVGRLRASWA